MILFFLDDYFILVLDYRKLDMNLTNILQSTVRLFPQKKAIVCKQVEFSYEQFVRRVGKLANFLKNCGIRKGKNVAVLHRNCHFFLESYFGVVHTGAALVPLNCHLSSEELSYILNDSEAELLIAERCFSKKVDEAIKALNQDIKIIWTDEDYEGFIKPASSVLPSVDVKDDDISQIYYTSGTTGRPKGVVLSHKNVFFHAQCTIDELDLNDSDVWLHAAPMFHLADAWATWAITIVGGTHILESDFDPKTICSSIEKQRVTLTNMVPTMYYRLVNFPDVEGYNYSSLRVLMSGGAPISPNLVKKIIDTFKCDYIQTYGLTETSPFLTMSILKEHLRMLPFDKQLKYKSTTGKKFKGIDLRIVNTRGEEIKSDNKEVGEIIVRGATISRGYWKLPQETKKAFKDGWLYTGDMAVIDKEGYVTIVDRKDDMIITGGENVYSIEVENVLYTHPSVLETAVIGVPNEEWGEIVKAIVVLKDKKKASEKDIIDFCKNRLAAYKVPKQVEFRDCLPKLGSGKICKKDLKKNS
jgi:acyl-CoA synthetase (AMP-forming)/AMP-acid ligase II